MNEILYLSEFLNLSKRVLWQYGIFNRIIGCDSFLFIDPRLLSKLTIKEFSKANKKFYDYFGDVLSILKFHIDTNKQDEYSLLKAKNLLTIKEIKGIGLGYSRRSDNGGGVGPVLAEQLTKDGVLLLEYGERDPKLFEILGLFRKNFGKDRLSDMVVSILLEEFLLFTLRVMKELSLKGSKDYDFLGRKWDLISLPNKDPLIFIPRAILTKYPISLEFSNIETTIRENFELRDRVNKELGDQWYKKLKNNKDKRREIFYPDSLAINKLIKITSQRSATSYDFTLDELGESNWLRNAQELMRKNPFLNLAIIQSKEDLLKFVDMIIDHYKYMIEEGGGANDLYNETGKILPERISQKIFRYVSLLPAKERDIDISPETDMGRGPVDFKFSKGFHSKIVVEMKLSTNRIKDKAIRQVEQYLKTEQAEKGYLMVIKVREQDESKINDLLELEKEEKLNGNKFPKIVIIDGLPKKSASKL